MEVLIIIFSYFAYVFVRNFANGTRRRRIKRIPVESYFGHVARYFSTFTPLVKLALSSVTTKTGNNLALYFDQYMITIHKLKYINYRFDSEPTFELCRMMRTGEPIETHPSSLKREGYLSEREGFPLP